MTFPNFLIIGAAKSGTTSLHYYLSQHPEIFMTSVKEPRFFALENKKLDFQGPDKEIINSTSITNYKDYLSLFHEVNEEKAIGETSPLYLYCEEAAERIKFYLPDVKLIAILRNPIDRAFSCYTHLLREGYETLPFVEALKVEKSRILDNWPHLWHYVNGGFYYKQIVPYHKIFGSEKVQIYLYDELVKNPIQLLIKIFEYLEVDSTFTPNLSKKNISGVPKNRLLHNIFNRKSLGRDITKFILPESIRKQISQNVQKCNLEEKPVMTDFERNTLTDIYREDIQRLQGLIQQDLTCWL